MNCVANGRIQREGPFEDIWVQPAAGDAGGALGVAFALWHRYLGKPRISAENTGDWKPGTSRYADAMQGTLLGPRFSDEQIASWLRANGVEAERAAPGELPRRIAKLVADGKVVGLFQGRMEFGPRALGCRSIIGDARSPSMQSLLNIKIKFRESFRPFAPAVLREKLSEWFELDTESPYMLLVANVNQSHLKPTPPGTENLWGIDKLQIPRSTIPAVTHVDNSARVQTVRRSENPLYYDIIRAFFELTGCPVIVNTSFNVRDEPIVCSPDDAYRCFMKTEMDVLVMESYVIVKKAQACTEAEESSARTVTTISEVAS